MERNRSDWVPPVPFNPNHEGQLAPAPLAYAIPFATIGILIYQPVCTVVTNMDGLLGLVTGLLGAIALVTLIAISSYSLPPGLVAFGSFCSLWLSIPAACWLVELWFRAEEAASLGLSPHFSQIPKVYFCLLAIVLTAGLMIGFIVTVRRERQ